MGIKKTKRVKVWCSEKSIFLGEAYFPNIEPIKDMNRMAREKLGLPRRIRCPECNRRLRPKVVESADYGEWYVSIPAHKKTIKDKKDSYEL